MSRGVEAVYLSPHLDDAALSCGGQIAARTRAGQRVVVVTVFAADEPAEAPSDLVRGLHEAFAVTRGVVAARRAEDEAACACLRCEGVRWAESEGIYRVQPPTGAAIYPTIEALFGAVSPLDDALTARLAERMGELPPAAEVFAPLGVGGHVDHLVVRAAAQRAFGGRLEYYEDYPYVQRPLALRRAIGWGQGWRSRVAAFGAEDLEDKIRSIACYGSQVKPLFGNHARFRRRVEAHCRQRGGERLWRQAAAKKPAKEDPS